MSSGRGPGFIGMMMALVVLVGFGLLYVFVFDAEMQGNGVTIESVVRDQQYEIDAYTSQLAEHQKTLETVPAAQEIGAKCEAVEKANEGRATKISQLKETLDQLSKSLLATAGAWDTYKEQYRANVRTKAVGETMEHLTLKSGNTYDKVEIREVTPVGIQIRHESGQKRVAFEELPADLQDRFQFDTEQKQKVLARELAIERQHEQESSSAAVVPEKAGEAAEAVAKLDVGSMDKETKRKTINDLEIRLARVRATYNGMQADAAAMDGERAQSTGQSRINLNSKNATMRTRMQAKQAEISALARLLAELKNN